MNPVNVSDFRNLAKRTLAAEIFDFIDGGSCDEITKLDNKRAFDSIRLRPFCLRDVSKIDTSIKLPWINSSAPILIAPMAFHQLVHPQGESGTAKAAKTCGIPLIVSSMSNQSLEEIASQSQNPQLLLQTYIFKNRTLTEELVYRAEKAGYKSIVVTVGTPITGKRDRDIRNQFILPPQCTTGNFSSRVNDNLIYQFTAEEFDASLTWKDIEWIQSITTLPIVLKGILNPQDAETACQLNIAGIVVSNHGGRQLDTSEATINVLPDIIATVAGRTPVLIDGAIERGTDILKAIALGADAVLIGRPTLWSLAVNGEQGVESMLTLLKDEFEIAMKLSGLSTIQAIKDTGKELINGI
ncbi:alpha-hydroxy acid oxidase [Legionella fallonii]|uniref:Peroxisomal (S)-2-hydroxy-acid oxidase GLO3 n=1 Tax=Legionella fallonii LLAP-10 TaxID=1212491 RepID=A0A098G587_9GAMM|nr:alpha-hydroxy acid oxidase [Legionella fallonii]CEG56645.1 Peroxisomal (S)-2-hydroxy-acid oxidase GLO3 [Legionella fallonii LLAP-10]